MCAAFSSTLDGPQLTAPIACGLGYGQSRVQVVWNRVILPDTSSFQLDKLVGTDPAGYAGLEDGARLVVGIVLADPACPGPYRAFA